MRLKWIIGAVVLVVAAAIGAGAYYVFGGNAPPPPKLSAHAPDPGAATGANPSPAGKWAVQRGEATYVGYRMQELFAGETIHKTAVGRTPAVSGTMTCSDRQVQAAQITADLTQLKSDRGPRDSYLHTHALETDTIPNATFTLAAPAALPSAPKVGQQLQVPVTGRLALHGVTRAVTLTLTARWNGSSVDVVGTTPIKLADYSIQTPKTSVVETDDHGSLELSLHLVRAT